MKPHHSIHTQKPYCQIPIRECGEPLVPIPLDSFAIEQPHPYQKLGAPYGEKSPYYLRQTVIEHLLAAQVQLQQGYPGWRIQIFDAYRPIAVQQFMVDYTFAETVQAQGMMLEELTDKQRQEILNQVYQFWAVPSSDPATPPPHSTGAAVDVTLVDAEGQVVNMGSPIDELSPRSYPNHFAASVNPIEQRYHDKRQLLRGVMVLVGFQQHPDEWWHFSLGDQMWAWSTNRRENFGAIAARYGAI